MTAEPKTCPHCGSGDVEDCPIPARKVIMWFCNCCGRGWTEKEP